METTMRSDQRSEEIHLLQVQIRLNEMLPADMQCEDGITKMKARLARLQEKPNLKLVTQTSS
jgi:hypothetical protein